jgi:hypothetical protein
MTHEVAAAAAAGHNSDFTICLEHPLFPNEHEELKVHSLVLAVRSPVLCGMFENDMAEAQSARVVVTDVIPVAFKFMLHFIYTEELPEGGQGLP